MKDAIIIVICNVVFQLLGIQERSENEMIMKRKTLVISHCPNELNGIDYAILTQHSMF